MLKTHCRFCDHTLNQSFCDLGKSPFSNSYLKDMDHARQERSYPLHAYVCDQCYLVQLEEFESPSEIFSDYAYFSSYSDSWLKHSEKYVDQVTRRFGLNPSSHVVEIASNDGYLLQYFVAKNIPVLGIEPAANVAKVAESIGVPSLVKFFGTETAKELVAQGKQADLLLGNNVLAHVPKLNDFVEGMKILLKPNGVITMEFPHLLKLIEENQFDTIYHEHFSYFSLITVERIFAKHGLEIFDVEQLPTHGGSLRIYAKHKEDTSKTVQDSVTKLKKQELERGLNHLDVYREFQKKAIQTKEGLLKFLKKAQEEGKTVVGYGAPAKGNTLLNYCHINQDLIAYTVDRSPHKQGRYLPGTHLPIKGPEAISQTKPDYLLILPWNLKDEIMQQMAHIKSWGGKFVIPLPTVEVL
jgi:2-polyprenyl-3-methyl-5-hydroxy-6-metoxy-1,4-benzoquinol methylase